MVGSLKWWGPTQFKNTVIQLGAEKCGLNETRKTNLLVEFRILTHNLLAGPKGGYPLKIRAHKVEELESEYDAEYIKRLLAKIEWNCVISALGDLHAQGVLCYFYYLC